MSITSNRPVHAAKIFTGKLPSEVLAQLPLLFSVCGIAQAAAASDAFEQALGFESVSSINVARKLLVHMETAREHLWRIFIDWPALISKSVQSQQMAAIQPLVSNLRDVLFVNGNAFSLQSELKIDQVALNSLIDHLDQKLAELVFGCSTRQWLSIKNAEELSDWYERTNTIASSLLGNVNQQHWQGIAATSDEFLPELSEADLNMQLQSTDADQFIATPMWQNNNYETTALARLNGNAFIQSLHQVYGNGVLTRLTARLVELAEIPDLMRELVQQLDDDNPAIVRNTLPTGTGIGQVEAARGRLVHRVVMEDSNVGSYQILAPTEWNFHPKGVVAHGLEVLPGKDEETLRKQATLLINAVDPCVGYDLKVY